jgi:cytochrome c-type biogenesis protein CcmH/NrfG
MMLWFVFLLLIAVTTGILVWPLMQKRAPGAGRRLTIAAIILVLVIPPAGAMIAYAYLGAPELADETQLVPAPEDSDIDLAAEAEQATRAAHNEPSIENYNRLGDILFRMGNYNDAAKAYDQAARLDAAGKTEKNNPRK